MCFFWIVSRPTEGEKTSDVDIEVLRDALPTTLLLGRKLGSTVDRLRARSSHLLTEAFLDSLAQGRTQTRWGFLFAAGVIECHALRTGEPSR